MSHFKWYLKFIKKLKKVIYKNKNDNIIKIYKLLYKFFNFYIIIKN